MKFTFVTSNKKVKHIIEHLKDQVKVLEDHGDGYSLIEIELKSSIDALYLLHAGNDAGLELGLYGPNGKPDTAENILAKAVA